MAREYTDPLTTPTNISFGTEPWGKVTVLSGYSNGEFIYAPAAIKINEDGSETTYFAYPVLDEFGQVEGHRFVCSDDSSTNTVTDLSELPYPAIISLENTFKELVETLGLPISPNMCEDPNNEMGFRLTEKHIPATLPQTFFYPIPSVRLPSFSSNITDKVSATSWSISNEILGRDDASLFSVLPVATCMSTGERFYFKASEVTETGSEEAGNKKKTITQITTMQPSRVPPELSIDEFREAVPAIVRKELSQTYYDMAAHTGLSFSHDVSLSLATETTRQKEDRLTAEALGDLEGTDWVKNLDRASRYPGRRGME